MYKSVYGGQRITWGVAFFLFGALLHFFLWRSYLRVMENGGGYADSQLANISILFLGGVFVAFFMSRFLRKSLGRITIRRSLDVMAKAGLYGMAATVCTFESFFLLFAAYGAIHVTFFSGRAYVPRIDALFASFLVFFIDIQLEGTILLTWSLPFAFVLSSFLGIAVDAARKRHIAPDQPANQKPHISDLSAPS